MKKLIFISILSSIFLFSSLSFAWHCGKRLVMIGDSSSQLLRKCGSPSSREVISHGITNVGETVERWYYYRGSGKFSATFYIKGGTIVKIKEDMF
jgi:hypothetical protein